MKHSILIAGCLFSLLAVSSPAHADQGSGTKEPICKSVPLETLTWHPVAWPSAEFLKNNRLNYLGTCDAMLVEPASGTVTVRIGDIKNAETIRCKYELAGLGEMKDSAPFRSAARNVIASCWDVSKASDDADLYHSILQLHTLLNE